MTKHSLYQSQSRYEKATVLQKTASGYQRNINELKRKLSAIYTSNRLRKHQIRLFSRAVDKSITEGKLTKEWWNQFLPRKKTTMQELGL